MSDILKNIKRSTKKNKDRSKKNPVIVIGNIWSHMNGYVSPSVLRKIDNKLSYFVQGVQYSPSYRKKIWDGYIRLFNKKSRIFPTGFLGQIQKILNKCDVEFKTVDKRRKIKYSEKLLKKALKFNKNIKPRPYQKKALKAFFKHLAGVINIPTGTGKTLIINLIIKLIDLNNDRTERHLIVTHGTSLLHQLKDEIEKFQKEEIGYIGGGTWNEKRITVASIDTLFAGLQNPYRLRKTKKKKTKDEIREKIKEKKKLIRKTEKLLASTTAVYCDEAHHSPAKTFKTVLNKISNASFRTGFTATYKRSGGDEMLLRAVTGKIIFKRSLSWMIDRGYLAKPTVLLLNFEKGNIEEEDWHDEYAKGISENSRRNKLIAKASKIFYDNKLSTVMFVVKKQQGSDLFDLLSNKYGMPNHHLRFMMGRDDQDTVRKPTLMAFRRGEIRNLICTRILNEGIDFPEANCGIKCGAQQFEGNTIQQLGRVLRKTKNRLSKDIDRKKLQRVFWLDIMDMHSKTLANHSLIRAKTYESEKVFDIRYINSLKELKEVVNEQINEVKIIKENPSPKENPSRKEKHTRKKKNNA